MSTATPTKDDTGKGPVAQRVKAKKTRGWPLGTLLGLPALAVVILAAWVWWRLTANLGEVEERALDWGTLRTETFQHLKITVVTSLAVLCTAIPVGTALTRPALRRYSGPVVAFANGGQAAPVIGVIVLLAMWLGFGFWTAVLALAIYAFLPVLRNTIVGLLAVDQTLVEAAQGMGMSKAAVLARIEFPMAVPIIMAGVRTALVLVAGTASFGTFINAGGLGYLITTGITLSRSSVLISGTVIIAVLALMVDWIGRMLEVLATPKGLR